MDLINEYEKEIKELKKQKESIEKLSEQSANLKVERDKKKQELDKIQDYKSAFYEDLSKEYSEKDSEFATSLAHEELAKRNLKRNLEEKKSEILNGLETKLVKVEENRNNEFAKMEQDEVKKLTEEKKKLEEELKLNDVTKEEWLKLPIEEQIRVNHAKEQYLNNKHRLQEIEPKLEIANIYEGKTPIEKYTEIKEEIDVVNKEFTLENLDNLVEKLNQKESKEKFEKDWEEAIKENEEFDKRKAVRKDLDERTERAIENNKKENGDLEKSEKMKNEEVDIENIEEELNQSADKMIEETKKEKQPIRTLVNNKEVEQISLKNLKEKEIVGINIREGKDAIDIVLKENNNELKTFTKENILDDIVKDSKRIFNEPNVASSIETLEKNSIKRFFLKRKLNPVILEALNDFEQNGKIIEYVKAVKNKQECENLKVEHDLSETVLTGKSKRIMKRVGKAESQIEGMSVIGLKENKIYGLLEKGKRKIKNKPVTTREDIKLEGKIPALSKTKNVAKKAFKAALKVPKTIAKGTREFTEYLGRDEDLERETKQDSVDENER